MSQYSDKLLKAVVAEARDAAAAAQAGLVWGNNGVGLAAEVEAYVAGLERRIPSGWSEYLQRAQKAQEIVELQKDPEWSEYQRLRKKFDRG